jgi:hypothetical protein
VHPAVPRQLRENFEQPAFGDGELHSRIVSLPSRVPTAQTPFSNSESVMPNASARRCRVLIRGSRSPRSIFW